MKIFYSEGKPHYESYTFNYGVYCLKENNTELEDIYDAGFLPYSNNKNLNSEIFYLARSLRVNIASFSDTSENRRVNRKIEPLGITIERYEKEELLRKDAKFLTFCHQYVSQRIEAMSQERLAYVLKLSTGTHIFKFELESKPVGYVLAACTDKITHYWFSFFDTELMRTHSLGKWMMWAVMRWCKEHSFDYVYLGTAYGTKSLYKIRDHNGLEYFDGMGWNTDIKTLKSWCKQDEDTDLADRLKRAEDMNEYLVSAKES